HRLVAEDVARPQEGRQHLVQVQVRTADAGAGDPDHGVGRLLEHRPWQLFDPDVPFAVPPDRLHPSPLSASLLPVPGRTAAYARQGESTGRRCRTRGSRWAVVQVEPGCAW